MKPKHKGVIVSVVFALALWGLMLWALGSHHCGRAAGFTGRHAGRE